MLISVAAGVFGLAGSGGSWAVVATSTVNRPVDSRIFFMTGVVCCHAWLFCPSMMSTLIGSGSAADAGGASANAASVKAAKRRMGWVPAGWEERGGETLA